MFKQDDSFKGKDIILHDHTPQWREIVGHFDALNAQAGTEKVSKSLMHNRRRRARQREEAPAEHLDQTASQEALQSWEEHMAAEMQEAMNGKPR